MALMPGSANMEQWQRQREAMARAGAKPKNLPQFGLKAETRLHEGGIASNHGSALPW